MHRSDEERGRFPALPAAVEVEIELTNICNAMCVACPRDDLPTTGRISRETVDRILDGYDGTRADHPLNRITGGTDFPRVTLAGGGDPLIHSAAVELIAHIRARGYAVNLITNGAALTEDRIERLLDSGVDSISCSFWGIRPEEYEAAMRLPYARSLRNVERLAARARERGTPFCILWVRVPEITSTTEEIASFWAERGIDVDLTDNHMWNRGGLTRIPPERVVDGVQVLPDETRRIWCADLYFSDTWTWDGRCLLCCCNYFTSRPVELGRIDRDTVAEIARRKAAILEARPLPAMCQVCRQPRALQAAWLAAPWRPLVAEDEWEMVTYADTRVTSAVGA